MGWLTTQLGILPKHRIVSAVGSGGKTTLLQALAEECAAERKAIVLTTTTHIIRPDRTDFQYTDDGAIVLVPGQIVIAGTPAEAGKLSAPAPEALQLLCRHADRVFVEADGSRMLPLKYPNQHEPVILPQNDLVIAVAGLSALGNPLEAVCHRAPLAQEKLGISLREPVTPQIIAALLLDGYRRWNPVVLLNQADNDALRGQAELTAKLLTDGGITKVVILSLKQGGINHAGINQRLR